LYKVQVAVVIKVLVVLIGVQVVLQVSLEPERLLQQQAPFTQ
jgi:hypothetical protein